MLLSWDASVTRGTVKACHPMNSPRLNTTRAGIDRAVGSQEAAMVECPGRPGGAMTFWAGDSQYALRASEL